LIALLALTANTLATARADRPPTTAPITRSNAGLGSPAMFASCRLYPPLTDIHLIAHPPDGLQ